MSLHSLMVVANVPGTSPWPFPLTGSVLARPRHAGRSIDGIIRPRVERSSRLQSQQRPGLKGCRRARNLRIGSVLAHK